MQRLGYTVQEVRTIADAKQTSGLIIPGGESTVIGQLLRDTRLGPWITQQARLGYPVYGTCAGCILIATQVDSPYSLKLIDISVQRNAFGRQLDSFEMPLKVQQPYATQLGVQTFTGVFIRAPQITRVGSDVETIISYAQQPVLVRQKNILAGTFHPELSETSAIHEYFGTLVQSSINHQS